MAERMDVQDVETWQVLVVVLIGAGIGLFILFFDFHWWNDFHRDFASTGAFVLWAGLTAAQTALWGVLIVWLRPTHSRLRTLYGSEPRTQLEVRRSTWAIALTVVIFIAIGAITIHWPPYLMGHWWKLPLLAVLGSVVGFAAARGIWLVHGGLRQLVVKPETKIDALETFLGLKSDLQRFLGALGAILGLLVLATGAQRQAVLAYPIRPATCTPSRTPCPITHADYGYGLVLVYGFFFTILIAAAYMPTHMTLSRVGARIRDAFFPEVPPSSSVWQLRTAKRERLGALLQLDVGPLGQLKTSAAILAPLGSSLIALLLTK